MRSLVVAALLTLAPTLAVAETWSVVSVGSRHWNRDEDYNEQNWGLGFEQDTSLKHVRLTAGTYRNSGYRDSWYTSVIYLPWESGMFKFGGMAGLITGYIHDKAAPMAGGVITVEDKRMGLNFIVFTPKEGPVVGFQIKFKIR